MEDNFFTDPGLGSGFGMIQAHYVYRALYVYYDYISSTSDHQALDPRGGGPLPSKEMLLVVGHASLTAEGAIRRMPVTRSTDRAQHALTDASPA